MVFNISFIHSKEKLFGLHPLYKLYIFAIMKSFEKILPPNNELPVDYADLKSKNREKLSVILADNKELKFSLGKHNKVPIAIIEEFAPRFAPGSKLLYMRDTANKELYTDIKSLKTLGIPIEETNKLPVVILYDLQRQWLFLFEVGTSHGPVTPERMKELENMLKECKTGKVYVSVFSDFKEFNKYAEDIAWDTEVWLMDFPEHMIHFNGDNIKGPRESNSDR